jgi:uncharacterized protein YkwD
MTVNREQPSWRRSTACLIAVTLLGGVMGVADAKPKVKAKTKRSRTSVKRPTTTIPNQLPLVVSAPSDGSQADRLLALVNVERTTRGLVPLVRAPALDALAQDWAQQMPTTGFTHRPNFLPLPQVRALNARSASENIANGYNTVGELHAGWMNSEGHRRNILRPSTRFIGIGISCQPNGLAWSVQDFVGEDSRADTDLSAAPPFVSAADDPTPLCGGV